MSSSSISAGRWLAKKAARKGLAAASWASGSLLARRALAGAARLRVLCYHRIADIPRDPFCVTRSNFGEQMRWLAETDKAISLAQLEAFLRGELSLQHDSVLITIDDGCVSTFSEAAPILRDLALPAVAYVTGSLVSNEAAGHSQPERYLTWDELAALPEAGIRIGSHAWTHSSLGQMSLDEARVQAHRSKQVLEERLGLTIDSFAYPFGTRADFSDDTNEILADAGYRTIFTTQHGAVSIGMNPISLPRVKIEGGESLGMFKLCCAGAMDAWRGVDYLLWRAQQSRNEQPLSG